MFEIWGELDFSSGSAVFRRRHLGSRDARPFPESSKELRVSPLQIVADADLFNGCELNAGSLNLETIDRTIEFAYLRWKEDFPNHLDGEFSIAIWDSGHQDLYLFVDHLGMRPLFYWSGGGKLVFASDPLRILSFPYVPRKLNRRKLAGLTAPGGWEYRPEDTIHKDICSVPPGSFVKASRSRVVTRTYWYPNAFVDPLRMPDREVIDLARHRLFSAIRKRIRHKSRIAAWLSGGLDSSAVVSIASRCLAEENRSLTAFAAVSTDQHLNTTPDEREYVEEFRSFPNVEIQYVTAESRGPFDVLQNPDLLERCFTLTPRRYHEEALERAACDWRADITLLGSFGELTVTDRSQGFYAELAKRMHWIRLWRELRARQKARPGPLNPVRTLRPLLSDTLECLFPLRTWKPQICFSREFINESEGEWAPRYFLPRAASHQQFRLDAYWRRQGTRHSTRGPERVHASASYPLLDKELLELCLAIPPHLKVKNGRTRNLVRSTLSGVMPEKIRQRASKIPFSPDYFIRFNSQLPLAKNFISSIHAKDPVRSIIDIDRVRRLLQPVDPVAGSFDALMVPINLYIVCFLRQFAEFRA